MSILQDIVAHKKTEVSERRELLPTKLLERSIYFDTPVVSLSSYLQREDKAGIIAEIKRASPSAGALNPYVDVERLSIGYMQAGASALSILSDQRFFSGSNEDVQTARKFNFCPILRKDFIIDEYQLIESRSIGADCILLIAAALAPKQSHELARQARKLGLEVLLEVHNEKELDEHLNTNVNIVGVNNRNLNDFSIDLQTSEDLAQKIPKGFIRISESGITKAEDIVRLKRSGFDGFLIGSYFMKHDEPAAACARLVVDVQKPEA